MIRGKSMQEKIKLYVESLRLTRWPRSLAIIPGFLAFFVLQPKFTHTLINLSSILRLLIAFLLTWFISTANYIVNEITDAPFDAFHPSKKNRPLVKNKIDKKILMTIWFLLVIISLLISFKIFNVQFVICLISLLIAGIVYNVPPIRVKDIPFLDSTIESINNPIRFLIGWYIMTGIFPTVSILISWWFFGNFLMVGKRVAEKKFLTEEESSGYRISLKKYSLKMLITFMILNAIIFIVSLSIFTIESKLNSFLYSIPFILIYLLMFMKKSIKDIEGAEEPERLLKNPYFAFYTLFIAIIFIIAYIYR